MAQGTGKQTKFERVLTKWDACPAGMQWVAARGHRTLAAAWDDSYNERRGAEFREWFTTCLLDDLELWCTDTGYLSPLGSILNDLDWHALEPIELRDHYRRHVRAMFQRVVA